MEHPECLLCRVVRGELPARKVVETERVIGVVNDAEAFTCGHLVFFPRRHAPQLTDIDDGDLAEILVWVKRAAAALEAPGYNVLQNNGVLAGQTVFHVHVHLIPKWSEDDGLVYRRVHRPDLDHGDLYRRVKEALARRAG